MQFENVKQLLKPLIKKGQEWQFIDINGNDKKPKYYFSDVQWVIIFTCIGSQFQLTKGLSGDVVGYIMSAFSISVSLFMSLLVSIFDKFENTDLSLRNTTDEDEIRLIHKKNFFKRFISITSYLVILSIFIIILCSLTYFFNTNNEISYHYFTVQWNEIDVLTTVRNILILLYRCTLYYFLLTYLFLTLFVAGSAYEYYISEIDRRKIK
ncbi:hypothetical protein A1704_21805 [Chryseobacterium cucumeris]|uniref:hypothetical protein n=1 Tax=Chryseobacterium cucumeris TaxID=1813611 RepID=UPI000786EBD2|nr:hypothetical protein [Chryseobacterium cucumeris]KYH07088.1 hypothetical protein A1704_21805 [Chryseobacterium cucumeris]